MESGIYTTRKGDIHLFFGGKIGVGIAENELGENVLFLNELPIPQEIGSDAMSQEDMERNKIVFHFNNEKSIDVVIKNLLRLKKLCSTKQQQK